jgi:hypothetical protein
MDTANRPLIRALRSFVFVAAASFAAASIWASNRPEEGYLVDAEMWQDEVSASAHWPADGWYRIQRDDRGVDVRTAQPGDATTDAADAVYFRLPGTTLRAGLRATLRSAAVLEKPTLGTDYELALGRTRFALRVESVVKGMQYAITYGGQTHVYVLGPFDATATSVRAVADLDGDGMPDFLIDVEDATYLLLSTRAQPGANLPTAELWAKGC